MVARVLAGREGDGLATILAINALAETNTVDPSRRLLAWAAAQHGRDALDRALDGVRAQAPFAGAIVKPIVQELGLDPTTLGRELLERDSPELRALAVDALLFYLPSHELAPLALAALDDADERVRHAAMYRLPIWGAAEREAHPEAFAAMRLGLVRAIGNTDPLVVRHVLLVMERNAPVPATAAAALERSMRDPSADAWVRGRAMSAYLQIERTGEDQRDAIAMVAQYLQWQPAIVCGALTRADPALFDHAVLQAIVDVLPAASTRDGDSGRELLVRSPPGGGPRAGELAMPMLIDAVEHGSPEHARAAAAVLARLGPAARPAIPALIGALGRTEPRFTIHGFSEAMLAIDSADPSVRAAVEAILEGPLDTDERRSLAGGTLAALQRWAGDDPWAQSLYGPVARDPAHPLHAWLRAYPQAATRAVVAHDHEALAQSVAHAPVRDAYVRFLLEGGDAPDVPPWTTERDRRQLAARGLATLTTPSDTAMAGLVDALRSPALTMGEPPAWRRDETQDARVSAHRAVWELEHQVAVDTARALAVLLGRDPDRIGPAIAALDGHATALMLVLTSPLEDPSGSGYTHLTLPPSTDPKAVAIALDALLEGRGFSRHGESRSGAILAAIATLPTDDPRRAGAILHAARFGAGQGTAASATASLGVLRPATGEVLDELREAMTPPLDGRRPAAVFACERLGAEAMPLLPELLAIADEWMARGAGSAIARALEAVAPDDPAARERLDAWAQHEAARRRR
jgi:hypothetical protein